MKEQIVKAFAKESLTLKKHAPEILVISGIIGLITAGVLACKETTKLDSVLAKGEERTNELADKVNKVDELKESGAVSEEDYTEDDEKKDIVTVWAKNAFDIAKLYAPSIILAIASTSAILGGFGILKTRHAAITMAFGEMSAAFAEFKKRTQAVVGEEKYREILNGAGKELKEVINDNGETVVAEVDTVNPVKDPYTFIWSKETTVSGCDAYTPGDPAGNLAYLKALETSFNNKLRCMTGYVFLNEILDELGLPKTKAGQEVGWVMQPSDDHNGDNYIDFGIDCIDNMDKETMKFTRNFILHFNCDGYILDTFQHAFEGEK